MDIMATSVLPCGSREGIKSAFEEKSEEERGRKNEQLQLALKKGKEERGEAVGRDQIRDAKGDEMTRRRRTTDEQIFVGSVSGREDDTLNPVEGGVSLLKRRRRKKEKVSDEIEKEERKQNEKITNRERSSTQRVQLHDGDESFRGLDGDGVGRWNHDC